MSTLPDLANVTLVRTDDVNESMLFDSALDYLNGFSWVADIREEYAGGVFPGIIGIFLFRITPSRQNVDEWLWVITGDVPPAYITCDECRNPWQAIDGYVGALQAWAEAVEAGEPVDRLIPVNSEPTLAAAAALRARLKFLDERIMPLLSGAPSL